VGVGRRLDVESARDMQQALGAAAAEADVVVMAAAVADFRPTMRAVGKLSRRTNIPTAVPLTANPDLLAELGRARTGTRPLLVGFAAEVGATGEALVERARQKLADKRCDVVVANDVAEAGLGFGSDSQRRDPGVLGRRRGAAAGGLEGGAGRRHLVPPRTPRRSRNRCSSGPTAPFTSHLKSRLHDERKP
jgi:phosphopantothenoylcysteine decarboxylase/phosphopantothenate--cysteine ligase